MQYQVLARKWRPRNFVEIVGQPQIVRALTNALNRQQLHHAFLFTGTRGIGKTTIARIIAKCLNCEKGVSAEPCGQCDACKEIENGCFPDLYEVDAASRTKVEDTRELLDNVQYATTKGRYKVYLIDEVHMLSGHSFNALLKTLEEPPPHVKFLLATTDQQKLPATVLSRCLQFHLKQMSATTIAGYLQKILSEEKINFEIPAILLIAKAANGSMRDALSVLDQCIAFGNGKVLFDDVKSLLGIIDCKALYAILQALAKQDATQLLQSTEQLADQSVEFASALAELLTMLHQIAVLQLVPHSLPDSLEDELNDLAQQFTREDIQLYYQIGLMGQRDLSYAPTPRSGFEMTLLRMLAFTPNKNNIHATTTATAATTKLTTPTLTLPHDTSSWLELLKQLALTGATRALAEQCAFKSADDQQLQLLLQRKHAPLLQSSRLEKINQAVKQYFNQTITVTIDLIDQLAERPAEHSEQSADVESSKTAEQVILNNQEIQRIMQAFDAKLIKGSVIPVNQTDP